MKCESTFKHQPTSQPWFQTGHPDCAPLHQDLELEQWEHLLSHHHREPGQRKQTSVWNLSGGSNTHVRKENEGENQWSGYLVQINRFVDDVVHFVRVFKELCVGPFSGIQDGRSLDLLHQSDVDHHEPALRPGPQQVIFLLAGGKRAGADFAPCWSTLQLGSHLCPPAVDHESQSLRRFSRVTGHPAELIWQQHMWPWGWQFFWGGLSLRHYGTVDDVHSGIPQLIFQIVFLIWIVEVKSFVPFGWLLEVASVGTERFFAVFEVFFMFLCVLFNNEICVTLVEHL